MSDYFPPTRRFDSGRLLLASSIKDAVKILVDSAKTHSFLRHRKRLNNIINSMQLVCASAKWKMLRNREEDPALPFRASIARSPDWKMTREAQVQPASETEKNELVNGECARRRPTKTKIVGRARTAGY